MSLILGIESSCDETAAALVTSDRHILAHCLAGQESAHSPYGGVVPEIAARAHVEILPGLIEQALAESGARLSDLDAIAATAGPGLVGGVMVGLVAAKGLALAAGKPLVAVNHLEGHALSPMLSEPGLAFPYLLLLVSGGHCQLLHVEGLGCYRRLATTIDDAAGEAFDKTAKLLGLGFPGGPAVERAARAIPRRFPCRARCWVRQSRISPSPASRARCFEPGTAAATPPATSPRPSSRRSSTASSTGPAGRSSKCPERPPWSSPAEWPPMKAFARRSPGSPRRMASRSSLRRSGCAPTMPR
jgi:hypothetical protein